MLWLTELEEEINSKYFLACEHGEHSNHVDPQQTSHNCRVDHCQIPSTTRLTLLQVVTSVTVEVQAKEFHAGQQRAQTVGQCGRYGPYLNTGNTGRSSTSSSDESCIVFARIHPSNVHWSFLAFLRQINDKVKLKYSVSYKPC